MQNLLKDLKKTGCNIHIVSSLYDIIPQKLEVEKFSGIATFKLNSNGKTVIIKYIQRALDIFLSLIAIIVLLPVWLVISLFIVIESGFPIFYIADAVGKNGIKFKMFKFRSMISNCKKDPHKNRVKEVIQNNGETKKIRNDNRITKFGKCLRKYSLDELPQLINVLKGDMSLVGPRPNLPYEFKMMDKWHKKRHEVLPGITGLWQIHGRDEVKFNDQIVLDLYYVENQSIKLYFEILIKTIPVVIFGKGGY